MKYLIKRIYKLVIPVEMQKILSSTIVRRRNKNYLEKLRKKIISFYKAQATLTPEQVEIVEYLNINTLKIFPYLFTEKYSKEKIKVYIDEVKDLRYVIHENKRLYFKKMMSENAIKSLYKGLLIDQDEKSPHKYLDSNFRVNKGEVVVDAGAAEGNFSLSIVEQAEKIYLFESDPEWIEPLQATFEPWVNKVTIVKSHISNESKESTVALDDFYLKHPFTFVKADIEGDEDKLLEGFQKTLASPVSLKLALCTYHKQNHFIEFSQVLEKYRYKITTPPGYMIFYYDKQIKAPFLRRGLIRAWKNV